MIEIRALWPDHCLHDPRIRGSSSKSFCSAGVARKEYDEFSSNIDLIDVLPPGLYEAVLEAKGKDRSVLTSLSASG